ncbi:MAG: hypothetical protein PHU85_04845 [Phycisphaerae bacterium]|nr:hypothetical protein [Phycisphaerae bacterium]
MSRTNQIPLPSVVGQTLGRYRRRWRVLHASGGLFATLAAIVAGVALAVAADRWLRLPAGLRLGVLVALAGMFVGLLAVRVFWPMLRRLTNRDAAVQLGSRFPDVKEDLVTAVELTSHEADKGISRSLIVRALDQISSRTTTVNPRRAVPVRSLLLAMGVFLGLSGLFQSSYLLRPEAVRNALVRLLMPNRNVPYYSYTKLEVTSGDRVIAAGDTVELAAAVAGRVPPQATLELVSHDGRIENQLPIEAGGKTHWTSGSLFKDLRYRFTAGDAISPWGKVRVVPAPSLASKQVLVKYPDYTGGQDERFDPVPGVLAVVEGSTIQILVTPVRRGGEPEFVCRGQLVAGAQTLPLTPGPGGSLRSAAIVPAGSKTIEYVVRLTDGFGLTSRTPDSVVIKLVADQPPTVTIAKPARDLLVLPGESVTVEAAARDDFGLRELSLATRQGRIAEDGKGVTYEDRWHSQLLKAGDPKTRELAGGTVLNIGQFGLRAGDILVYKAASSDYAGKPELRTRESATYRIVVMSESAHLAIVLSNLKNVQIDLLRLAARQRIEAAAAGKLAGKADREPVNIDARDAQERQKDLIRQADKIARDIESAATEMTRNPSASPKILAEMEKLGRSVRAVGEEPMTDAANKEGEAADNKKPDATKKPEQAAALTAAKEHGEEAARRLEALAKAVEKTAAQGQMERLAAAAELLAAQQRNLKESTTPVGKMTLGTGKEQLPTTQRDALEKLAQRERDIKNDIDDLARELAKAAAKLADSSPSDAGKADKAAQDMESGKMSPQADEIAKNMNNNQLGTSLDDQQDLARKLADLAKRLRSEDNKDEKQEAGEQIIKEIDKFIARQRDINAGTESAIARGGKPDAKVANDLGGRQSDLGRDVSEQSAAIRMLVAELENFTSQTALKLDAAAREMRPGAIRLYDSEFPEGLDHGKKALALLLDARKDAEREKPKMNEAGKSGASMAAMLLLQRIVNAQKAVNQGTIEADKLRAQEETFKRLADDLVRKQTGVKVDADRLADMLAQIPELRKYIQTAGEKMDVSRLALTEGDTGDQTRIVQRQIIAMLEALMQQQPPGGGGALQQARIKAMMQMMQRGSGSGGYAGGSNANLLPSSLGQVGNEAWRRSRQRFDETIGASYDTEFPAEYKDLLNAYFDKLRKEPPK